MKAVVKKFLRAAAIGVVLICGLLWITKLYRDAHYFDNYDAEAPLNVEELESSRQEAQGISYTLTRFTFEAYGREKVPALISIPKMDGGEKLPVVLLLHGIGQNKNFLKEICIPFNQTGFVIASFDQYTQGERKLRDRKSLFTKLEAFRLRPAKTVNESRKLIDYLSTRPGIDTNRIYLVGASYGAVTGTTLMAKEGRIRAGIMVYGGGDLRCLIDSYANRLAVGVMLGLIDGKDLNPERPPLPKLTDSQTRKVKFVLWCMTPVVRYFLGVADPVHHAGKISPRPVYFQNGMHDVLVSAAAGRALQKAAKDPKKVTWYDSDHVGINHEQTREVLKDGLKWLIEQDNPLRKPDDRVTEVPDFQSKKT